MIPKNIKIQRTLLNNVTFKYLFVMTFKFWIKNYKKNQFFLWFTLQNVVFYTTGFFRLKGGNKETKVVGDNYWRTDRQIHTEIQTETETKIDVERKWRVEQQFLRGNNCSQGYVSYINRPIGKRLGDFNLSKKSTFSKVRSVSISSFIFIEVASLKLVAYSVFFRSNHICQTRKL
jgi:hypothetical protein